MNLTQRDPGQFGRIGRVLTLRGRIHMMEKMHRIGLLDPDVRQVALGMVRDCPARNDLCEARSIFEGYRRRVRYVGDVAGIDTFASARRTLMWRGGDCDDATVTLATLARHVGFEVGAKVVATGGPEWNHVYAIVGVPKDKPTCYLALDPTVDGSVAGWEPAHFRARVFRWE